MLDVYILLLLLLPWVPWQCPINLWTMECLHGQALAVEFDPEFFWAHCYVEVLDAPGKHL